MLTLDTFELEGGKEMVPKLPSTDNFSINRSNVRKIE